MHNILLQKIHRTGQYLTSFLNDKESTQYKSLNLAIDQSVTYNAWLTKEHILFALEEWAKRIPSIIGQNFSVFKRMPKTIALLSGDNYPLVGFSDVLAILLSGNRALIKAKKNESILLKYLCRHIATGDKCLEERVSVAENLRLDFDAIIVDDHKLITPSSVKYFKKNPCLLRKRAISIASLDGNEEAKDLEGLATSIFTHFGFSPWNVKKLLVPEDYDFKKFYESIEGKAIYYNHNKYANNYDYQKSIYLMNKIPHFDNGFLLLKQSKELIAPTGVLYYDTYKNETELDTLRRSFGKRIQAWYAKNKNKESLCFTYFSDHGFSHFENNKSTIDFIGSL